jgi:choline dehydrogenase-like flavoprotein
MISERAGIETDDVVYDVCIVGAGAAGITLALRLADAKLRVCVIEAGGRTFSEPAQSLCEGVVDGDPYPPLRRTRFSALGGSTAVWAGWCRPLDPIDFEGRPDRNVTAWPFDLESLLPWYRDAHTLLRLAPYEYDAAYWQQRLGAAPLVTDSAYLQHALFHVHALNIGHVYRDRLERDDRIYVMLHTAATRLDVDEAGRVLGARVQRAGRSAVIRAARYVLAAGGIENARLLLLSADEPARAPGNAHDNVGRFFTDHPFINPGSLVLNAGARRLDFYFPQRVTAGGGAAVRATLTLPRTTIEREALPGAALFFHPRYESHGVFSTPEVRALLEWRDTLRSRAVPGQPLPLLARALRRPDRVALAALRRFTVRDGPAARWRLRMMFETTSAPGNRVQLCSERDRLGRPRARVHWRLDDDEIDGMRRTLARFDDNLRAHGVGRIEPALHAANDAWRAALEGGKHHMGTTRMHRSPAHGVVDENCLVHGMSNLFVSGSSVFPSSGYANPTLTVVALAARLGDHLARSEA